MNTNRTESENGTTPMSVSETSAASISLPSLQSVVAQFTHKPIELIGWNNIRRVNKLINSRDDIDKIVQLNINAEYELSNHNGLSRRLTCIFMNIQDSVKHHYRERHESPGEYDPVLCDKLLHHTKGYRSSLDDFLITTFHHVTHMNIDGSDRDGVSINTTATANSIHHRQSHSWRENQHNKSHGSDGILIKELDRLHVTVDTYTDYLLLIEASKNILHLTEIMCIDTSIYASRALINWYHHLEAAPVFDMSQINDVDQVDSNEVYWLTIHHLVITGRLFEAVELLNLNIRLQSQHEHLFSKLHQLISSIPSIALSTTVHSEDEFMDVMRSYRQHVDELLHKWISLPSTQRHANVERLLHLLLGDENIINDTVNTWYELLTAHLLLINPLIQKDELHALMIQCIITIRRQQGADEEMGERMNGSEFDINKLTALEQIHVNIFSYNLLDAIQLINSVVDIRWFTAIYVDLLHNAAVLPQTDTLRVDPSNVIAGTLREHFIVEYAQQIMSCTYMYDVALQYFSVCAVNGIACITRTIELQTSYALNRPELRIKLMQNIEWLQKVLPAVVSRQVKQATLTFFVQHDILEFATLMSRDVNADPASGNADNDESHTMNAEGQLISHHLASTFHWLQLLANQKESDETVNAYISTICRIIISRSLIQQYISLSNVTLLIDVFQQHIDGLLSLSLSPSTSPSPCDLVDVVKLWKQYAITHQQLVDEGKQLDSIPHSDDMTEHKQTMILYASLSQDGADRLVHIIRLLLKKLKKFSHHAERIEAVKAIEVLFQHLMRLYRNWKRYIPEVDDIMGDNDSIDIHIYHLSLLSASQVQSLMYALREIISINESEPDLVKTGVDQHQHYIQCTLEDMLRQSVMAAAF